MNITATIITLNEQKNIARSIKSLRFADEIIVIDSFSSDDTVKIAQDLGAQVYQNNFNGFGQQKNFAAQRANSKWILNIDADEEVDITLQKSIIDFIKNHDSPNIAAVNRRTNYCNQWIYHGGWYPDVLPRLYQKDTASWSEPNVHEKLISNDPNMNPPILNGHLNHYSFPTIKTQIETNIKYAKLGAKTLLKRKRPLLITAMIKPFGKFIECYIIKKGFLDGVAGLIIAINASYSIFMKYIFAYKGEIND